MDEINPMIEYKKFVSWAKGSLGVAHDDWESDLSKLQSLGEAKRYIERAEQILLLEARRRRG